MTCKFCSLQWADEASLDTIQLLALDCDVRYCHYLLSFRDDEDEPTRRVTSIIDKIELHGVPVTKIKLGKSLAIAWWLLVADCDRARAHVVFSLLCCPLQVPFL